MADQVGFGVIGCGGISAGHLPAQRDVEAARTVAVCDINEEAAKATAAEYDVETVYTDWRDVLANDRVDAVAILLPHHLHREVAVAAAEAGKHVLCEKPMAVSLQEADDMIAAAERADVTLMVGQILRFREVNIRAREMIRDGAIGEVRNVMRRRTGKSEGFRSAWASDPEEAGGWVLYGYGAHEVDMILWLNDAEALSVYAQARRNNEYWNDFDEITLQMGLSNDAMATYQHSINTPFGQWDCMVIGTEGAMLIEGERIRLDGETIDVPLDSPAAWRGQIAEFVSAVLEGREPVASGRDVRRTMAALEAAKISIREGTVIDVSGL